ncbi:MAG TPA: hypothetical protein P5256_00560 [Beijerinckiaceae bacterium]|jgi:hypothetical protein|nr:hypothetical protein [Rhodoblastus sp.]MCC2107941.1 hypothetical protein [Hyphomicrobiales bacterium]MCO5086044.1 hypothetical protein [Methylobacteriaceae bacterium]HRY01586.1 hypothetical protein [Beijerinckiaceae bacterium]
MTGLVDVVTELLDRVELSRVGDVASLSEVALFRYRCYRHSDMVDWRRDQKLIDEGEETPNAFLFAMHLNGILVGTFRIHFVESTEDFSQAFDEYPDVIGPLLANGESYLEPTRLAIEPAIRAEYPQMKLIFMATFAALAGILKPRHVFFVVRREHVPFYTRGFGFQQVKAPQAYHGIKQPLALMGGDYLAGIEAATKALPYLEIASRLQTFIKRDFADLPAISRLLEADLKVA